jgi:hypothetical protein
VRKTGVSSFNTLGFIPHERLFGFVGRLISGRIEKWSLAWPAADVLGCLARAMGGGGDGLSAISGNLRSMNSGYLLCFLANWK